MTTRALAIVALALAGAVGTTVAEARDRTDVQFSVQIGPPVFGAWARPLHDVRIVHAPFGFDRDHDGIPNRHDRVYNPRWDRDGDGVPNRYDRVYNPRGDRDGDGIPNRYDRVYNPRGTATATASRTATTGSTTRAGTATATASRTATTGSTTAATASRPRRHSRPLRSSRRPALSARPLRSAPPRTACRVRHRRTRPLHVAAPPLAPFVGQPARAALGEYADCPGRRTMPNRPRAARLLAARPRRGWPGPSPAAASLAAGPARADKPPAARHRPGEEPLPGRPSRRRPACPRPWRRSSPAPACRRRASPSRSARSRAATPAPLLSFRADQPILLASTAKLVTSLAALDLLGPEHRWRSAAYSTGRVIDGRLRGDLVIAGGPVGLTGNELRRWFVAAARGRPADDLRPHRPRGRRPAARARAEAGPGDRGGARPRRAARRPHLQPGQAASSRCGRPRASARR